MASSREREKPTAALEDPRNVRLRERLRSQTWRRVVSDTSARHAAPKAPAALVLGDFERLNARAGHENAGFLSTSHGFMPRFSPLSALPRPFAAWDQLAAELPALHQSLSLRRRVEQLPLLDASAGSLDEAALLRACALLAIVAHAYWYVEPRPPEDLPLVVRAPWKQVRERLHRSDEVLSYIDLIVYNWRLIDVTLADPMVVENLDLLLPTIGNREERVFYLTQVEILARTSPVVRLIAAAQDAVMSENDGALEAALLGIIDCLSRIVRRSLLKLDPNPYSPTYVNPVVWAKTVAPFAVPFHAGIQGPSGTSSPLFNTLDLFFGRKDYNSFLGREIKQLRVTYPRAWQSFLGALTQVSVAGYVERSGSRSLKAAFREAFELYAGNNGFLGRHRMKVYGYLELAFKVGRSVTIGGFGGVFTDRTWDLVDNELVASQAERLRQLPQTVHRAKVVDVLPERRDDGQPVGRVLLDVAHIPLSYQAGDRCLILPENEPELIVRTLRALSAHGDELVALTDEWRALAKNRPELKISKYMTLCDLLRYGCIRPVSPRQAEALHARTQLPGLIQQIDEGRIERLELWELLTQLRQHGFDPSTLWREPGVQVSERFCRLVPPLRFRVYSISSASHDRDGNTQGRLELTVGQLRYESSETAADDDGQRFGTASTFLMQARRSDREVPFCIERPDRFVLPDDPATPIVMFAGGTGISPFRAFLEERTRTEVRGENWLFLSLRSPSELIYGEQLASAVLDGALNLNVAFTREPAELQLDQSGKLAVRPGKTKRIDDLLLVPETAAALRQLMRPKSAGGGGAQLYICGRSGFAARVLELIKRVLELGEDAPSAAQSDELLYRLVGERRLTQEIHSDTQPLFDTPRHFELSEIARHNDGEHGYWIIIDRVVYDMTRFMELHPGGRRIVQAYAGTDATHGFARAHHQRPDVDAMRESYRIGVVRSHSFDDYSVQVEGPSGPLTVDCGSVYRSLSHALQLVVEMQNALLADQSLQDEKLVPTERAGERTPYKLVRSLETYHRFVASYLGVLVLETLPGLWRLCRGLFFPDQPADWLSARLAQAGDSAQARASQALTAKMFQEFESWKQDPRTPAIARALEQSSRWFLTQVKGALIDALHELERHGANVRQLGAARLQRAFQRATRATAEYHARLASELALALENAPERAQTSAPGEALPTAVRRLHSGTYWLLEEDVSRRLVILQRTPTALASLLALAEENERVLALLTEAHREYGLVVDTRQVPMRNDGAFEDAMANLRSGLTGHFKRTAVLLESKLGELQVARLTRDERRAALATRSESTAFKFAMGAR